MRDNVKSIFYSTGIYELISGKNRNVKIDFDFTKISDKRLAYETCPPLSICANKILEMFSNFVIYVMDEEGNEIKNKEFNHIRNLLKKPNPLQTDVEFFKEIELYLKLFGYCPIQLSKPTQNALPYSMVTVKPENFHAILSGKKYFIKDKKEIIKKAFIEEDGKIINLEDYEYLIISNNIPKITGNEDEELKYSSCIDSLSEPVNNWMAQMSGRYNLIVNGGPKGIIYGDDNSEMGNLALTDKEKQELNNNFKSKFGLVGKAFQILVSKAKLGWIPLNYNSKELQLHEEDERCRIYICNALGLNPNIFTKDPTHSNQNSAYKSAYQDLIIPDANAIAKSLTEVLFKDGKGKITIDYTHISYLQEDEAEKSNVLLKYSSSLQTLVSNGIITKEEARILLAKIIDINPKNNQKS